MSRMSARSSVLLTEMVRHHEQHAESDQYSEPERRSDQQGIHFVLLLDGCEDKDGPAEAGPAKSAK